MPLWSSLRPSSRGEQSMPCESTPIAFFSAMTISPTGAPIRASGTLSCSLMLRRATDDAELLACHR